MGGGLSVDADIHQYDRRRNTSMTCKVVAFLLVVVCCGVTDGVQAGSPITCGGLWAPDTSEEALRRYLGPSQVSRQMIDVGEGELEDGSVIYPNTPGLTILVLWKDSAGRRHPSSVRLRKGSTQVIYNGIGIGTTLKALERLNGRPFQLAGFDFDYSGTVTSWQGGRLEEVSGSACEIKVRLQPVLPKSPSREQLAAGQATEGDRDFQSSDKNMQLLNPRIYEVLLIYR
jgi:hypothetical protein